MSQERQSPDVRSTPQAKDIESKLLETLNKTESSKAAGNEPFPRDFSASGDGKGGGGNSAAIEP